MVRLIKVVFLGTLLGSARAVDINGDPMDLSIYPACAQECIPRGLGPPADCGSLSSRTCICNSGAFATAISGCELLSCSKLETSRQFSTTRFSVSYQHLISLKHAKHDPEVNQLSGTLCAPVGGVGPVETAAAYSSYSVSQLLIPATPTYPPSITAVDQASSFFATASLVPDLGNPFGSLDPAANIYPACAGICSNLTSSVITDPQSIAQLCDVPSRTQNAHFQRRGILNDFDVVTQLLAQEACDPYYVNNATLAASVTAALASAMPLAQAVVAGSPSLTDPAIYPLCASCRPKAAGWWV
ncbi:MAG: hypothetical protein Q9222_002541 [Ikaeria aurantiellina]